MNDEAIDKPSVTQPDPRVRLAFERTFLAYERTRIAWVRTALALISFGFVIAKFFQYLREKQGETATVLSPRAVGLVMITIGLLGLILANWQERPGAEGLARALPRIADAHCRCDSGVDCVARCPGPYWRDSALGDQILLLDDRKKLQTKIVVHRTFVFS
jgi:uncharacterized membrane protein YidH (DUF202 family)